MNSVQTALGLAVLTLLVACSEAPAPAPEVPQPIIQGKQLRFPDGHPQLALIGVTAAAPGKAIAVEMPARLVWNEERTQRVYPAFSGRVLALKADIGQAVKPGSVLAELASPEFGIAQAETARANIDAQLTQKTLQRQKELFDAGIIARKDLDQAEADAARAQAEATRTVARTTLYGGTDKGSPQQLALRAGMAGIVVERNLNPGQELRPEQSGQGVPPLFVITDPSSLWVQIDARETEISTLHPGSSFELSLPTLPGQRFRGVVTAAADFIDPSTRTIKIRGTVANPDRRLKAEMLATARIERSLGEGVLIPANAVVLQGTRHLVFVQAQPGVFEVREVTLSYQGPREVGIASGLQAGERVVSENTLLLARQMRIAMEEAKPEASAGKTTATQDNTK